MISKSLRLLRRFKGLSQTEMAQRLRVTKSWISEIEGNKKEPTLALLLRYSDVLDIPLSSILFFSENMDNHKPSERARNFVSKKVLAILDYIDAHAEDDPDNENVATNASDEVVSVAQAGQPSSFGGASRVQTPSDPEREECGEGHGG